MEQVHRDNLEKLGRYLANLTPKHNEEHFNMRKFAEHDYEAFIPTPENIEKYYKRCYCGTVGCAVGHAPLAMPKEFMEAIKEIDFVKACTDAWGEISEELFGLPCSSYKWDWLFGGAWAYDYNHYAHTSWAVADRIIWLMSGCYDEEESQAAQMTDATGLAVKKGWTTERKHKLHLSYLSKVYA